MNKISVWLEVSDMDDRFHYYKDCRILSVYKQIRANVKLSNEFLIEIAIDKQNSC